MLNTVLGIDVGTTGTKAMLMDEGGTVLKIATKGYNLYTPGVGLCEQNAENWWSAVIETVRAVCDTPERAKSVRGLSLSTQGGTVVPVDQSYTPLCNAIVWSDARCAQYKKRCEDALGADYVYRKSGWKLISGLPLLQLYRLRLDDPALFNKARYFLTVPDYITAKLTDRPMLDYSNAGINQLTDISSGKYDKRLLDFVGIKQERLAEIHASCTRVGTLSHAAAEVLGLDESVIVTLGAHDQYAVALGVGIVDAGDAVIGTGTAWVVTALSGDADFESGFAQSVSASKDKWGTILSITTGGVCLDWFRKQVGGNERNPLDYDTINRLAVKGAVPGSGGLRFYPYFSGAGNPEPDDYSKAAFLGLDLSHDQSSIIHAIMEGVSCQTIWALKKLEKRSPIKRLVLTGGATKSALWTQMIADIASRPVYVPKVADPACVGAAMMAGVGCGLFRDTLDAVSRLRQPETVTEPVKETAHAYCAVYHSYVDEAIALKELYSKR